MHLEDAKLILTDVLNYAICDSIVRQYELKDAENSKIIVLQKEAISKLTEKCENQSQQMDLLNKIINNKDSEITLLNDTIKAQKKEIRKQKILKFAGFTGSVVLPIVVALLLVK